MSLKGEKHLAISIWVPSLAALGKKPKKMGGKDGKEAYLFKDSPKSKSQG